MSCSGDAGPRRLWRCCSQWAVEVNEPRRRPPPSLMRRLRPRRRRQAQVVPGDQYQAPRRSARSRGSLGQRPTTVDTDRWLTSRNPRSAPSRVMQLSETFRREVRVRGQQGVLAIEAGFGVALGLVDGEPRGRRLAEPAAERGCSRNAHSASRCACVKESRRKSCGRIEVSPRTKLTVVGDLRVQSPMK